MSRLCAYSITPNALRDLTGSDSIPPHWFDWEVPADHGGGQPLRRLRLTASVDFADNEAWVDAVTDFGLTPYMLVSADDGTPTGDWPTSDAWLAPVSFHCTMAQFPAECEAIADELSQPDQVVLGQWSAFCLGLREPLQAIEAPGPLLRPYAAALGRWVRSPQTAPISQRREEPDYAQWTGAPLREEDFAFWPAQALSAGERADLYIPLAAFPLCGVGAEGGVPAAFGLLPQGAGGLWLFGDGLRLSLLRRLVTPEFGAALDFSVLMARITSNAAPELSTARLKGGGTGAATFDINLGSAARALGADEATAAKWDAAHLTLGPSQRPGSTQHVLQLHGASAAQKVTLCLRDGRTDRILLLATLGGDHQGERVQFEDGFDLDACRMELDLDN